MTELCKAEEVARTLGIEVREVWLLAAREELTPCLQFTNELMHAISGLRTTGLVMVSGLFTLDKGSIADWLARGTGTFDSEIFFPVSIDYIHDESMFGHLAVDADTLEKARLPWVGGVDAKPDKYQLAVSLGESASRTISLDDFVFLRKQLEAFASTSGTNSTAKIAPLSVFHNMSNLHFTEVTIEFVPGGVLEVSARKIKKTVSYAEFGILNRKEKKLNRLGDVLLRLAKDRSIWDEKTKTVSDVRGILRQALGITSEDPFQKDKDRTPHFTLRDARRRSDNRANDRARNVPLDDNINYGTDARLPANKAVDESEITSEGQDEYPFKAGSDAAGEFLKNSEK